MKWVQNATLAFFLISVIQLKAQEVWNIVDLGISDNLVDIYFLDNQYGWIIGSSGTLIRTTNGGDDWSINTIPYQGLSAIQFVNENTGWIVGSNGLIINSTDGGDTWTGQEGGQNYYLDDLHFFNKLEGLICGGADAIGDPRMLRTTNSGSDWNEISINIIIDPRLLSIYFIDSTIGWTTGMWGYYFKTTNAGISWNNMTPPFPGNKFFYSIYFIDDSIGISGGDDNAGTGNYGGIIYRTEDGGKSWKNVFGLPYSTFFSIAYCVRSKSIYAAGNYGQGYRVGVIYKSTDKGDNWSPVQIPDTKTLKAITFTENKGWAIGYSGILLTATIPSSVNELELTSAFHLFSNYPNPFNPTTKIKFQIPETGITILKIYDVLGNEVTVLINEEESAGSYEVEFNGTGLPSGIYFYQLKAGNYVATKKMILLK